MHAQVLSLSDSLADLISEDSSDSSTRSIRALSRGLKVLTALNRLQRAAISDLTGDTNLPRTTIYRILETLRLAGYVERDAHDCYRPTIRVRALSEGFDVEALLVQLAKPLLLRLSAEIAWPIGIATPFGTKMLNRE